MSSRVLIDARMVTPIPHGIGRYVNLLADGLAQIENLPYDPVFLTNSETKKDFTRFETLFIPAGFLSARELIEIPRAISRAGIDLYHSPSFSSLAYSSVPWIVTLHDLNHLTYGDFARKIYYRVLLKRFARGARALLTVSDFSRCEIAAWTGISERGIEVVTNAIDPAMGGPVDRDRLKAALSRHGLEEEKYFFCLSNSKPHKNVATMVEAYCEILPRPAWKLALTAPGFEERAGVVSLGGLAEEEARMLTVGAGAVVFPSLYEGFGLPPVEGAVAGRKLVVSRIPPHVEGLADLLPGEVWWVDPRDRSGWVNALTRVMAGESVAPSAQSLARLVSRFSVARLGTHMDQIYRRVLKVNC